MTCQRCQAELPEFAHFCQRCGADLQSADGGRRRHFALKPDEPVASFALVSTIMPRGVGHRPQTYRWALVAALTLALLAAILGALPVAILLAAAAIPLIYIVYLYDVNLWDDQPIPVTLFAFGATFLGGLLFTVIWTRFQLVPLATGGGLGATFQPGQLLLWALVVPLVGEAIRQVGPVLLASQPRFDDLMDGLTFGVVSGVAYSAAETLVLYWPTLTGGYTPGDTPGVWIALIFLQGFVKPLVLGTATGLACAEYSGLGKGYDGLTPRYVRGLAWAVAASIALYGGIYLLGMFAEPTTSAFLSVGWGMVVLAVLIIRIRSVLHTALYETALETAARDSAPDTAQELQFCLQCEMPLLPAAAFCTACGAAVRGQRAKPHRPPTGPSVRRRPDARTGGGDATPPSPAPGGAATAVLADPQPDEPTAELDRPSAQHDDPQPDPHHHHDLDRGDWFDGDAPAAGSPGDGTPPPARDEEGRA